MTDWVQSALVDPPVKALLERMLSGGGIAVGAAQIGSVSAQEFGSPVAGAPRTTVLTLNAVPLTVRDTQQGGGVKIYSFDPKGKIYNLGSSADLAVTTTSVIASTLNSGVTCQIGVGSTTQANATLATTEQNFINNTAFVSSTTINVPSASVHGYGAQSSTVIDLTSAADLYLNIAVALATDIDADASVLVSGTVTLNWLRT